MLTAAENVELPQAEAGAPAAERRAPDAELLEYVGLARSRATHRPSQLSGGEMQRVAIARALANRPALLLADEPTGELDEDTGEQIAGLFDRVHADGTAIVVVTHNPALARARGAPAGDEERTDRRMMLRLALRSLATRPVRTAVLAVRLRIRHRGDGGAARRRRRHPRAGALARALQGGGDLVVYGALGQIESARFVLSSAPRSGTLAARIASASPSRRGMVYVRHGSVLQAASAKGGVPSRASAASAIRGRRHCGAFGRGSSLFGSLPFE